MEHMLHEIEPFVSQYGLFVVFIGMMVEGTTMILLTGVLCYLGMLTLNLAIPVAILGAVAGDNMWYLFGRYFSNTLFDRFELLKQKAKKLEPIIQKRGRLLAFSGRFVYSGAIVFPFTLGSYRYPYSKFFIFDTIGVSVWAIIGTTLGYTLGLGVERYIGKFEKIWHIVLYIASVAVIVWIVKYLYLKKSKRL